MTSFLLIGTVSAIGVLHTLVPDHWAPIVVVGRQQGWSIPRTAGAAAIAGLGHVTTTLALGALLWLVGTALAVRYAHAVSLTAAVGLIAFGAWIAYSGFSEVRESDSAAKHTAHAHIHRHPGTIKHVHWHEHDERDPTATDSSDAVVHEHAHKIAGRTALLLIIGSSPMIEGIPAFFAASMYGLALLGVMALAFAVSTIATYVTVSSFAIAGLQRISFGSLERYGEMLSGSFVCIVGIYALFTA